MTLISRCFSRGSQASHFAGERTMLRQCYLPTIGERRCRAHRLRLSSFNVLQFCWITELLLLSFTRQTYIAMICLLHDLLLDTLLANTQFQYIYIYI